MAVASNKDEKLTLERSDIVNPEDIVFVKSEDIKEKDTGSNRQRKKNKEDDGLAMIEDFEDDVLLREISIKEKVEDARGRLAIIFTVATFCLFILGFVFAAFTDGNKVDNLREIFLTISGVFSGLLGFVVGYYFRRGEEK